jgi:hypothetical protein
MDLRKEKLEVLKRELRIDVSVTRPDAVYGEGGGILRVRVAVKLGDESEDSVEVP